MPNPNNPDEHECRRCRDTGYLQDDSLCSCVGGSLRKAMKEMDQALALANDAGAPDPSVVAWAKGVLDNHNVKNALMIRDQAERAGVW